MKTACLPASLAGLILACAASAPAALIFSEGFAYPQNVALTGQGTWQNNAGSSGGNSSGLVNAGLTYNGLESVAGGWRDDSASLALANQRTDITVPPISDGSVVWFSLLVQQDSVSSSNAVIKFGGDTVSGNQNGIRLQIEGAVGGTNSYSIQGGIGGVAARSAQDTFTTGTTHLLVGQIAFNAGSTDRLTLWLNPVLGAAPVTGSILDITTGNLGAFTQNLMVRSGGSNLFQWDEFRLGDTFADVTPVPEPAPIAAVALALTLAMICRRRPARPAVA